MALSVECRRSWVMFLSGAVGEGCPRVRVFQSFLSVLI